MKFIQNIKDWMRKIEPRKRLASFVSRGNTFSLKEQKDLLLAGIILAGVAVIIAVSLISLISGVGGDKPGDILTGDNENEQEVEVIRHPLTGAELDEELEELPQVFGVMIENAADAWPLSGLDKAFLVIEAPVEGGIPRFIAFYDETTDAEKIGPVRSARPYYLDWNDELDAVYMHVGGSPEALDLIANKYSTIDLNQFWQSEYFYRETGTRFAPHNVFTDGDLLRESLGELNLDVPEYEAWEFKEGGASGKNESLSIDFANGIVYDVFWEYDVEKNQYLRYQGEDVMKMRDGAEIWADNVVVVATDIRLLDDVGRRSITTLGEGDAYISQNGEMYLARWKKDERTNRLRFFTTDGAEISLNPGTTWVEIVSNLSQATRR